MKFKQLSLVAATALLFQTATLTPVRAETIQTSELFPSLSGIELSPVQHNRLNQIRTQTRTQIENIFTSEQRDRFQDAIQQGKGFQNAIASLQLSPNQQDRLRTILQSAQRQVASIITPEQRLQIAQKIRSLMMQRNSQ